MALLKDASGVKLRIKVGDGLSPETFAAPCLINTTRGITFSSTTNEFAQIDCDNPDLVAWTLREKALLSCSISGAGTLNTPDVQDFVDWVTSENPKNVQVVVDVPSADGGVIFSGSFHLTEFAITGNRGAKQECTITLLSDGAITSAANT